MNALIVNGTILTMNDGRIVRDGALAIEGENIADVGKTHLLKRKYARGYERIDASRKIILPGLVNTHQHAAMSLLRGYADDLPLQEWLEKWIWPIEKHMTPADIYTGALLTAAESLLSGVTTVNTMYHYSSEANEARAFADAHLRGIVGHVCFSWRKEEDRNALEDLARRWHRKKNGMIRASVDPHAPYTVDPEYMMELKSTTKRLNTKYGACGAPIIWHTHIAETRDEPRKIREAFKIPLHRLKHGIMHYLDTLGVLDDQVLAAHCVSLMNDDFDTMRLRNVKVSHNPVSNLKLAAGISPVPRFINDGITVSLGTDSPCSNNTADMFSVIKTAALLHKGANENPTLLPAQKVLEMATVDGARALSWESEIGSVKTGKKADLILIDVKSPHLSPMHNETSHVVYAAQPADVDTVLINGKIVVESGDLTLLRMQSIMEAAEKTKRALIARLNRTPSRQPLSLK